VAGRRASGPEWDCFDVARKRCIRLWPTLVVSNNYCDTHAVRMFYVMSELNKHTNRSRPKRICRQFYRSGGALSEHSPCTKNCENDCFTNQFVHLSGVENFSKYRRINVRSHVFVRVFCVSPCTVLIILYDNDRFSLRVCRKQIGKDLR